MELNFFNLHAYTRSFFYLQEYLFRQVVGRSSRAALGARSAGELLLLK